MVDLGKTLDQLEGRRAEPPTFQSHLVTTCHALRQKPLKDFTVEDFRIMIGQNLSLEFLVPLAIGRLEGDPLAEGDFYPGDLLKMVLTIDPAFWKRHADLRRRTAQIAVRAMKLAEEHQDAKVVKKELAEAVQSFQSSGS
jgi:hypothetical protein